jgi:hypothetical protein
MESLQDFGADVSTACGQVLSDHASAGYPNLLKKGRQTIATRIFSLDSVEF